MTTGTIFSFFKLELRTHSQIEKPGFLKTARQLDPIGTLLFVPSIICLLLALQWGGMTYDWKTGRIIALLTLFGLLLGLFVAVQIWMGEEATVPSRIAAQQIIAFSSVFSVMLGGAFFLLISSRYGSGLFEACLLFSQVLIVPPSY